MTHSSFGLVTTSLLALVGVAACSPASSSDAEADTTYSVGSAGCTLDASLSVSNEPALTWNSCIMHYDAMSHVVTWQLLPPSSSGSLISPAAGAIVLSFDRDAPENSTFSLAGIVSPLPASVPSGQTVFAFGTKGGRAGGTGSVAIGSNVVDAAGGGGGDLSGELSVTLTNGGTLSGSFTASARTVAATGGGGASGGSSGSSGSAGSSGSSGASGGSCFDSSQCNGLVTSCANGGQGACYCAAACACAAACDKSCQAANSASAQSTNTPCAY